MKSIITVLFLLYSWANTTSSNKDKVMENQIKQTIITFTEAAEARNIEQLQTVLHPEFRVVLNRFKGGNNTAILSREAYLGMISAGKIGGDHYEIKIKDVNVHDHTGAARVEWKNEKSIFKLHFLFVQNEANQWQIISDMPIVISPN